MTRLFEPAHSKDFVKQRVQRFEEVAHVSRADVKGCKVEPVVPNTENLSPFSYQELSSTEEHFWSWSSSISLGSEFSDQELYTDNYSNMALSDAQTTVNITNLMELCATAETNLRLAREACEDESSITYLIQSHLARLTFWKDRLQRLEVEIGKYRGTEVDTYSALNSTEDSRQNIITYEAHMLGVVTERLAIANPGPAIHPGPS